MSGTSTIGGITLTCDYAPINGIDVALLRVTERISDVYRITVDLLTDNGMLDPWPAIGRAASVRQDLGGVADRTFYGIVSEMAFIGVSGERLWFRATIVPPMAGLALTRRSRCMVTTASGTSRKVLDVLQLILAGAVDVPVTTAAASLRATYPDLASAVQIDETDLDFFRRTAADAGIGWYFDLDGKGVAIRLADDFTSFPLVPRIDPLAPRRIVSAQETRRLTPKTGLVHAWSADTPATNLNGSSMLTLPEAAGLIDLFEQPYTTADQGNRLAAIRLGVSNTGCRTLSGTGAHPSLSPGYVFDYNAIGAMGAKDNTYVLTAVNHVGWQSVPGSDPILAAYLDDRAGERGAGPVIRPTERHGYGNAFEAVDKVAGYCPARTVAKPRLNGLMRATLCDNTGATTVATDKVAAPYMDAQGRYQVVLPFPDAAGKPGTLFAPLRMLTPFGGSREVWQMPLRIGTTVYLAFEGGDIDRPIIAGIVPNSNQPTPVPNTVKPTTVTTAYLQSVTKTSAGIVIKVNDGTPVVVAAP